MNCGKSSDAWMNFYSRQHSYTPYPGSIEAVKTVLINYVVFGEDDDTGYPFKPEHWPANKDSLTLWMNECFNAPQPTVHSVMNPDYISQTRVRFEINNMYFYPNSSILNNNNISQAQAAMNFHFDQNPDAKNQLNWYIVKHSYTALGYAWLRFYQPDNSFHPVVVSGSGYTNYSMSCGSCYFIASGHLRHELGHLFGLLHPYQFQGEPLDDNLPDFLDDLFPDPPAYYPLHDEQSGLNHLNSDNFIGAPHPNGNMFVSPKQIGRMHRSLTTDGPNQNGHHYLRHYAYGYSDQPRVIDTDETWDFTFKAYNDIVVKKGATLTLTCRLEMVPQASIIVERGGTLIVDGATITSARCGGPEHEGLWQGIQVWGDPDRHQLATDGNGDSYHGKVIVKNDALIENARVAIQAWRPGTLDHGGGIVQVEESTFRNSWKTIHFGQYTKSDSQSFIKNSTFETTQNLMSNAKPRTFIEGWSIRGVRVYSNTFRNTNPNVADLNDLGKGIYLESARALISGQLTGAVTDFCNEDNPNWKPNTFENLLVGVELVNFGMQQTNGIYTSTVNRNVFKNCIFGVQSKGMPAVKIQQNKVTTGSNGYWLWNEGISHRSYTGFSITENCIEQYEENVMLTGGIIVADVSGDNNDVYKNYSHNVQHAFMSNGKNRTSSFESSFRFRGLQFLCNENNGEQRMDFAVLADNPNDPMSGIRYFQGGSGTANNPNSAANLFTNTCATVESDFYNNTINPIVYFHRNTPAAQIPVCYSWNFTPVMQNVQANGCFSKIGTGGTIGVPYKSTLEAAFAIKNSQFVVVTALYHSILDAGNTDAMLQSINSSYASDGVGLKNLLLNNSPNLSDKLIQELIADYTILTNEDLLQIIAANPDIAHNEELLKILSEKANPMDEWMLNFLRNAGTYTTDRTELERLFAQMQYERDDLAWELVRYILGDSTVEDYSQTELIDWLNIIGSPRAKYMIIDDYASRANFSEALNVLNNMNLNHLDRFEKIEYYAVKDWLEFQQQLFSNGRNILELDSTEIASLSVLADNMSSNGIAGVFAANVINHYNPGAYPMGHIYPDLNKSMIQAKNPRVLKPLGSEGSVSELLIYPNPASDKLTVVIDNPNKQDKILIYDLKGNLVLSVTTQGEKYVTLDVTKLAQGSYLVNLVNSEGNELQNGKFVVK